MPGNDRGIEGMANWIIAMITALQVAPYVSLAPLLPYVIVKYKKNRTVDVMRCTCVYLFLLYCFAAYFTTMMSFPDISDVMYLDTPYMQLIPFNGFGDYIKEIQLYLLIGGDDLIKNLLLIPYHWEKLFNIILFVPFGFLVRYIFDLNLKKTALYGALLSFFFELTQLSGLFFIYPRPYRMCDTDDLIMNTLGAVIGWSLVILFKRILPRPRSAAEDKLKPGFAVSFNRRIMALIIDEIIVLIPSAVLALTFVWGGSLAEILSCKVIIRNILIYLIFMLIYRGVIMWILKGRTAGMRLMELRLLSIKGTGVTTYGALRKHEERLRAFFRRKFKRRKKRVEKRTEDFYPLLSQCILRTLISHGVIYPVPVYIPVFFMAMQDKSMPVKIILIAVCNLMVCSYCSFMLSVVLNAITHGNTLFHDRASGTVLIFRHGLEDSKKLKLLLKGKLITDDIDQISGSIYEALKKEGLPSDTALKAKLFTEGVMLEWIEGGIEGTRYELIYDDRLLRRALILTAVGKEVRVKRDENDYFHVLAGTRLAFEIHYTSGRNVCTIELE